MAPLRNSRSRASVVSVVSRNCQQNGTDLRDTHVGDHQVMLHYFKFRADLPGLVPAQESYGKRAKGRGWPDQCPPLRAANAFGWDVPAAFEMTFKRRRDGSFALESEVEVESDW